MSTGWAEPMDQSDPELLTSRFREDAASGGSLALPILRGHGLDCHAAGGGCDQSAMGYPPIGKSPPEAQGMDAELHLPA
jgi:hypothetical protein